MVSKKSLGIGLKNFGLRKKSRYQSQKFWSQKNLSIGIKMFGLKKVSVLVSKILVSKKSLYFTYYKIEMRVKYTTLKVLAVLISFSKELQVILLKDFVS